MSSSKITWTRNVLHGGAVAFVAHTNGSRWEVCPSSTVGSYYVTRNGIHRAGEYRSAKAAKAAVRALVGAQL